MSGKNKHTAEQRALVLTQPPRPNHGYSRRDFLKIVGAASGAAAVGCAERPVEKIIPYVVQPNEVIPGVAAWYAGSCFECGAGCGVLVRTREGRVVNVEGNPSHPVNKGGLCAIGHSSLQALYDPDRIREPLKREKDGTLKPVKWEEAISLLAEKLKAKTGDKKNVLLSSPLSGSINSLIEEFSSKVLPLAHEDYSLFSSYEVDAAAEKVFGRGKRTYFNFEAADVIVSFGAGFLETWLSPVEFSRQWAKTRKAAEHGESGYFIHFEPRLSLTAANADRWVMNKPGSEKALLLALLAEVVNAKGGSSALKSLVSGVDVAAIEKSSSVKTGVISALAKRLVKTGKSLIVAGGAAASGETAVECAALANLLNYALGNLGSTLIVKDAKGKLNDSPASSLTGLISSMQNSEVATLIVSGPNPFYALPESCGFNTAIANLDFFVAISTHLDETARQADLILPLSTSFESWADAEPYPGVYNLNQPAMQPLYETQSLGDTLIALANKLEVRFGEVRSFYDYLRQQWMSRLGSANFEQRWVALVEKGGDWSSADSNSLKAALAADAVKIDKKNLTSSSSELLLAAFPTINSADGRSANRPWMQELPDPLTTSVWGTWLEINSKKAAALGIEKGDVVKATVGSRSIEAPAYPSDHIHPELVAVPIGQGHVAYGRYAKDIGANPLSLLPAPANGKVQQFLAPGVSLQKQQKSDELVFTQMSDTEHGREILREVSVDPRQAEGAQHDQHGKDSHGADSHGGEHEPGQMYEQMEHPLYRWEMSVDLAQCTGCAACVVACYAENNVPVVGRDLCKEGREMSWLRVDRYYDGPETRPVTGFMPMMCQQCGNAPCEPVCPVYATYHNEEGLNAMVYNRCVGTRYCSNNCSYKVRRYNWFHYKWPDPLNWQLNPDVTVREVGVMEKCSFCVQRIKEVEYRAKDLGRPVQDGEIQPACASSCPTNAISFGNGLDKKSDVSQDKKAERAYQVLDHHINTQPGVTYLSRVVNERVDKDFT